MKLLCLLLVVACSASAPYMRRLGNPYEGDLTPYVYSQETPYEDVLTPYVSIRTSYAADSGALLAAQGPSDALRNARIQCVRKADADRDACKSNSLCQITFNCAALCDGTHWYTTTQICPRITCNSVEANCNDRCGSSYNECYAPCGRVHSECRSQCLRMPDPYSCQFGCETVAGACSSRCNQQFGSPCYARCNSARRACVDG